jgi:hypothetical protein
MNEVCKKCGAPVQHPPTGRPKAYCSVSCRRLAEFEIRRLTRALDNLEQRRLAIENESEFVRELKDWPNGHTHNERLEDVKRSIQETAARLKKLLADGEETVA